MALPAVVAGPLLNVPPRSRTPRTSYVPVPVGFDLRELGGGDHEEGPRVPCPGGRVLATRLVGGRIWRAVRVEDGTGTDPRKALAPEAFRAWLAGDPATAALDGSDVARCFAGTPLVARLHRKKGELRVREGDGAAGHGHVLRDDRERAARIGRSFLERDVALLSGVPHVRMRGPLAFLDGETGQRRIVRHPVARTSYGQAQHVIPFRVDRAADQVRFETAHPLRRMACGSEAGMPLDRSWGQEWPAGLFDGIGLSGDDDVDVFLAAAFRRIASGWEGVPTDRIPFTPERHAKLLAWSARTAVGLVDPFERADLCSLVVSLSEESGRPGCRLAAFAREVALPRLAERPSFVQVDEEVLGALAP